MKQMLSILILILVVAAFSSCAATEGNATSSPTSNAAATASPTENVEQTLAKMERDWADAIVKRDLATIDRLLADDFVGTTWDGKPDTKAQHIEAIKSGTYKAESMSLDNIKVRVFGDAAVVTLRQTEKSQSNGKDSSGRYLYTDTWIKRNGKWQVVADHGCTAAEK